MYIIVLLTVFDRCVSATQGDGGVCGGGSGQLTADGGQFAEVGMFAATHSPSDCVGLTAEGLFLPQIRQNPPHNKFFMWKFRVKKTEAIILLTTGSKSRILSL